ncbi:hypothetical protein ABH897_000027 [Paenibacillus sp. RC73]|uniref:hypothetical protein n=1 Tax=Paenibacillus sp. RC73 TaxID=3156250 RepID=UPI0038324814
MRARGYDILSIWLGSKALLMDERQQSPTMIELGTNMAKELRVHKPLGSISPVWLSNILGTPLGRKLGIPNESLDFIVDVDYPLDATRRIHHKSGLTGGRSCLRGGVPK